MELFCHSVYKKYSNKWVIKDFNYTFYQGQIYGISGPNGSGKSTLLHLLCNFIPCTKGKILRKYQDKEIEADQLFRYLSFASPYQNLYEYLTLEELITFHIRQKPFTDDISAEKFYEISNLQKNKFDFVSDFSSGMKQRLRISLALASDVSLIILDEPTSFLDVDTKQWYHKMLEQYKLNKTIIIASNDHEDFNSAAHIISV